MIDGVFFGSIRDRSFGFWMLVYENFVLDEDYEWVVIVCDVLNEFNVFVDEEGVFDWKCEIESVFTGVRVRFGNCYDRVRSLMWRYWMIFVVSECYDMVVYFWFYLYCRILRYFLDKCFFCRRVRICLSFERTRAVSRFLLFVCLNLCCSCIVIWWVLDYCWLFKI